MKTGKLFSKGIVKYIVKDFEQLRLNFSFLILRDKVKENT